MKIQKPDLDAFIHGGSQVTEKIEAVTEKEASTVAKPEIPASVTKKNDKKVEPLPESPEQRENVEITIDRMVKFPLELPEKVRKSVKRYVIDLQDMTMNKYILEAILEKLKNDKAWP